MATAIFRFTVMAFVMYFVRSCSLTFAVNQTDVSLETMQFLFQWLVEFSVWYNSSVACHVVSAYDSLAVAISVLDMSVLESHLEFCCA